MFLLHVRMHVRARREAGERRPPGKKNKGAEAEAEAEAGAQAGLRAGGGWPAAGAAVRLARARRAATSCLVVARGAANSK